MHASVAALLGGALASAGAVAWLALLWYAAPIVPRALRAPAAGGLPDHLRDSAVLGIGITLTFGLLHLSWGPLLLAAAAALAVLRRALDDGAPVYSDAIEPWLALPLGVVAMFALAALPRPPLDGDTLGYHLPNVLAWTRGGSLWETGDRYWWYPGGSELFAAGAAALEPIAVGMCGALAAAMATSRIYTWCRAQAAPPASAALVSVAFAAMPIVALQTGDLRNDVWLAAFFLESLWLLQVGSPLAVAALAVTALVKPVGVVYASLAFAAWVATSRNRTRLLWLWPLPLLVWAARDAVLWPGAIVPPATTFVPMWPTTVAAHGLEGMAAFVAALYIAGPAAAVFLAFALVGPALCSPRRAAFAGLVAALLFFVLPFGFSASTPQLAGGASLRFLAPALAVGAVALGAFATRQPWIAGGVAAACALAGAVDGMRAFWADGAVWIAPAAALALAGAWAGSGAWRRAAPVAALGLVIFAGALAGLRTIDMLDSVYGPTVAFAWLRAHAPARIVAVDVRAGAIELAAARSLVDDALDSDPCAQARARRALLVVGTDPDVPRALHLRRVAAARACGTTLYQDDKMLMVTPR